MKNILYIAFTLLVLSIYSCKKKDAHDDDHTHDEPNNGVVKVKFDHMFGDQDFALNSDVIFKTASGDTLKFTTFKYYISNIQLVKTDGTVWSENESYHLVNTEAMVDGKVTFELKDIPAGEYKSMYFVLGVDSVRNVSGSQTGDLDPANAMFWSWNTGYIFTKAEGEFKNVTSGNFMYHIGGFDSNTGKAIQEKSFDFPTPVTVNSSAAPSFHYHVDVKKMFDGSGMTIKVVDMPKHMKVGATAVSISQNAISMFELDHVHQ